MHSDEGRSWFRHPSGLPAGNRGAYPRAWRTMTSRSRRRLREWNGVGGALRHRLHQASRKVGLMTKARWTALVETKRADGGTERIEIASLERNVYSPSHDDLGLQLAEANELLLRLQSFLAQDHMRHVVSGRPDVTLRIKTPTARLSHKTDRHFIRPGRPSAPAMAVMRLRSH
jgi:hypothetical protein